MSKDEQILLWDQEEVNSFTNITALFEWLLLVLVLFYLVLNRAFIETNPTILLPLVLFTGFVLLFHYSGVIKTHNEWVFTIEIWTMTAFVTTILWYTHQLNSPLVSLYLLPVITSALMLHRNTTLLIVILVLAICSMLGYWQYRDDFISLNGFFNLIEIISPVLLVAYVTSILATDIKQSKTKLKILSETDQLTGILNMRAFQTFLRLEINRAQRYNRPFSLLMIDCDNLKEVNDKYGHEVGNNLLRHIAHTLEANLRNTDILARYGGDEFIILLIESDTKKAQLIANRLCEQIAEIHVNMLGAMEPVRTSVSIGLALYPQNGTNVSSLIAAADKAMYIAKHNGKNRAVLAP